MGNINSRTGYVSHQSTVSNVALSLVDFGFTQEEVDSAAQAHFFVNSNSIRIDWSGASPTVSNGGLYTNPTQGVAEDHVISGNENLQQFKMIRDGVSDAEVFIILES